jgi:L-asparaginase
VNAAMRTFVRRGDMRPRVAIFFTGGTISMVPDPLSGGATPALSGQEIVARVPNIAAAIDLDVIDYPCPPGPNWTGTMMLRLARRVEECLADTGVTGVVVAHGTDTLEETAYLFDLVLAHDKPIVFVGSLRHSSELSWDGPSNLYDAIRVAAIPEVRGLGVLVVMAGRILAAAEATKAHASSLDAFQARDFGPLGFVDIDRVLVARGLPYREHFDVARLEERVDLVRLTTGGDGRFIDASTDSGATRAGAL